MRTALDVEEMNMVKRAEMNEAMLKNITGGNDGDELKDHEAEPMYHKGQQVETFFWGWWTRTQTITAIKKDGESSFWCWCYEVDNDGWVTADGIQR